MEARAGELEKEQRKRPSGLRAVSRVTFPVGVSMNEVDREKELKRLKGQLVMINGFIIGWFLGVVISILSVGVWLLMR